MMELRLDNWVPVNVPIGRLSFNFSLNQFSDSLGSATFLVQSFVECQELFTGGLAHMGTSFKGAKSFIKNVNG